MEGGVGGQRQDQQPKVKRPLGARVAGPPLAPARLRRCVAPIPNRHLGGSLVCPSLGAACPRQSRGWLLHAENRIVPCSRGSLVHEFSMSQDSLSSAGGLSTWIGSCHASRCSSRRRCRGHGRLSWWGKPAKAIDIASHGGAPSRLEESPGIGRMRNAIGLRGRHRPTLVLAASRLASEEVAQASAPCLLDSHVGRGGQASHRSDAVCSFRALTIVWPDC